MVHTYSQTRINLIKRIVERAYQTGHINDEYRKDLGMSIEAADCEVGLNLKKLLTASPFNFAHDVCGIDENMNKTTAKLRNCFLPRCVCLRRPPNLPKSANWLVPTPQPT